jgi:hypothetical protein
MTETEHSTSAPSTNGHQPPWVPALIDALKGLRNNVRELTPDQQAIVTEYALLKLRLAGPTLTLLGPSVTGFQPGGGVPGTKVTITGQGLDRPISVHFASARRAVPRVVDATTIEADVPPEASTGPITVFTADGVGVSRENFVIGDPPSGTQSGPAPRSRSAKERGTSR